MVKKKQAKKPLKTKERGKEKSRYKAFKAIFSGEEILSSAKEARDLYSQSNFGEYINGKIHYSLAEALYLIDRGKIEVYAKSKKLKFNDLMEMCKKIDSKILVKSIVYNDLRNRGYLLKTALKFGADFRVYDKGNKPGKEHAKWLLFCVSESADLTWQDFSAKNRVGHSTNKSLLVAVVDHEGDVIYYDINWIRP